MFNQNGKISRNYITGALIGVGAAISAFYLYKKNQSKVDGFLKSQGIKVKSSNTLNFESMDLENLVEVKEHIEDLIAEKEITEQIETECSSDCK